VAELNFDRLVAAADFVARHRPLPAFPASERDLATLVDESVRWADIQRVVSDQNIPTLGAVEFFDIYRGKQVAQGKKSVAFRMVFRAPDRTLTREEVEAARQRVVDALAHELGAETRA